jgi:hypothetical protein
VRGDIAHERHAVAFSFGKTACVDVDRQWQSLSASGADVNLVGPPSHYETAEAGVHLGEVDLRIDRDPVEIAVRPRDIPSRLAATE